jgi:predicted protein tyrosine phosphatase
MTVPAIHIAPLERVPGLLARLDGPAHVIGLLGPGMEHPALPVPEERRLKLSFHDVAADAPGMLPPDAEHVRALIDFARRWRERGEGPLLVHCWMGVSRSPAAAFIVHCALRPGADEHALARELRALAPFATPNRRLVALADALLGREGRMLAAIESIGCGEETVIGRPVVWPLSHAEEAA